MPKCLSKVCFTKSALLIAFDGRQGQRYSQPSSPSTVIVNRCRWILSLACPTMKPFSGVLISLWFFRRWLQNPLSDTKHSSHETHFRFCSPRLRRCRSRSPIPLPYLASFLQCSSNFVSMLFFCCCFWAVLFPFSWLTMWELRGFYKSPHVSKRCITIPSAVSNDCSQAPQKNSCPSE